MQAPLLAEPLKQGPFDLTSSFDGMWIFPFLFDLWDFSEGAWFADTILFPFLGGMPSFWWLGTLLHSQRWPTFFVLLPSGLTQGP